MNSDNNYQKKSDEELVLMILKNQDDFLYLMKRYENRLFRYIRRISNISLEDAEDLLQEIFIKVYKNIKSFDRSLKFSSWIYRIARYHTISNYRKLKSKAKDLEIQFDQEALNNIASELDLAGEMDSKLNKEVILKAVNNLDIKYREVLILKFFEDKDYKEISFILKKPIGTVGTLINRAKAQLKDKIK